MTNSFNELAHVEKKGLKSMHKKIYSYFEETRKITFFHPF